MEGGEASSKRIVLKLFGGSSQAVQWLRVHASTSGSVGSATDQGTKILHATQHNPKKKKTQADSEPISKAKMLLLAKLQESS